MTVRNRPQRIRTDDSEKQAPEVYQKSSVEAEAFAARLAEFGALPCDGVVGRVGQGLLVGGKRIPVQRGRG